MCDMNETAKWLNLDDIATYLGVSKDTVRNWIKKNNMPAHKVGRLWKFRKSEVDHWISSGASKYETQLEDL
jgi:excisionase family DNA binding protein